MIGKDMFDCLEETYNKDKELVFLVRYIKNKKKGKHKILWFSHFDEHGNLVWDYDKSFRMNLVPGGQYYYTVKHIVRERKIPCELYRISCDITTATVRKETWWDRIKVWFFRKIKLYF